MPKRCDQCQVASIQGVKCHELGCPEAWRDELRTCPWCGTDFTPCHRDHRFCNMTCSRDYNS